jgi:lysophospholipase L1-like esterase
MGMSKWKLIAINLLVFFLLFNFAYWCLPALSALHGLNFASTDVRDDPRGRLPNYANVTWAPQHYRELHQLKTDYKSFIGWRRMPFRGETITIGGRYSQRRTINDGIDISKEVYFFGGSTMWGTGAHDDGTIPSRFAAATGFWSENFGEAGYTAHQSLILLLQLLQDGHRPNTVVFYDGVNEVVVKCRTELGPYSHLLEAETDYLLKNPRHPPSPISFSHYVAPLQHVAGWIRAKLVIPALDPTTTGGFDCDSKPEKARKIAENLVADWQMAKGLVESYGGRFFGVLQPVSYFSQTRLDHLTNPAMRAQSRADDPAMRAQFRAVYPLLEKRMSENVEFLNLVHALDVDEFVYVDLCHLSPNGNQLIAARIAKLIQP